MSSVLNKGAVPPGTYKPTRCTGTERRAQTTPAMVSTRISGSRWAVWKASILALAWRMAACNAAGTCAAAAANSTSETTRLLSVALSSSAVRASKAASPPARTCSKMARTRAATWGASAAAARCWSAGQVLASGLEENCITGRATKSPFRWAEPRCLPHPQP